MDKVENQNIFWTVKDIMKKLKIEIAGNALPTSVGREVVVVSDQLPFVRTQDSEYFRFYNTLTLECKKM